MRLFFDPRPSIEDTLMIDPPPDSTIGAMAALMPRNAPTWLTSITCRYSSSVVSTIGLKNGIDALFTSTSRGPNPAAASITSTQSRSRLTSCRTNTASGPRSAATFSPSASRTSVSTTRAPSATNRRASASPWPRAAPVITATLPLRRPMPFPPASTAARRYLTVRVALSDAICGKVARAAPTLRRRRTMKTAGTRGALLDAAEELFAERGVYGVSLGEVGRRANQHNRSTIQYHFGTREALIDAVAERHIAALNERRADLLRTLDLTSRGDDV